MNINVIYYAQLREAVGSSKETISVENPDAATLYDMLKARYDFSLCRSQVRLAINDAFVDWNKPLHDGDSVVFIPPVTGG
ncbi:MAG TPA: MoaD/ThiS family protein [Pontiella sp.]